MLFRGQGETVQTGLHFNFVEFDGIKIRIVEPFPNTEEFYGVTAPEPVAHEIVGTVGILGARDICKANEVLLPAVSVW